MVSCFSSKSKSSRRAKNRRTRAPGRTASRGGMQGDRLESQSAARMEGKETLLRANDPRLSTRRSSSALDEKYFFPSAITVTDGHDALKVEEAQRDYKRRLKGFRSSMIWKEGYSSHAQNGLSSRSDQSSRSLVNCSSSEHGSRCPEFCINLDVSSYDPGEVTVKFQDGYLLVKGNHHAETEYGNESCSFFRKYPIPPGIEEKDISYKTRKDGVLVMHGKAVVKPRCTVSTKTEETEVRVHTNFEQQSAAKTLHPTGLNVQKFMSQMRRQSLGTIPDVEMEEEMEGFFVQGNKYVLDVNLQGFRPRDVYVDVLGTNLCVKCEQEYEREDGVSNPKMKTKLEKSYTLPKDIDISTISSKMSDRGQMRIEIARVK